MYPEAPVLDLPVTFIRPWGGKGYKSYLPGLALRYTSASSGQGVRIRTAGKSQSERSP